MLEKLSLEGKTAIVTGGGTGLGKQMVLAMARAGADIALAARRLQPLEETAAEVKAMGRRALIVQTDVTDSTQVNRLVETVLKEFGKIDVMLNNAGIVRDREQSKSIWDITDEDWRIGIDTNMTSNFYCSRAVAKHMVGRQRGKIINVSSGFGMRGGRNNYMYSCAKGGVIQLTKSLAISLARDGVTSNCIVPGFLPVGRGQTRDMGRGRGPSMEARGDFIPVGRVGYYEEIGPLAVFLASDASDYMNGEIFVIDGGGLVGGYAPTGYSPVIPLD